MPIWSISHTSFENIAEKRERVWREIEIERGDSEREDREREERGEKEREREGTARERTERESGVERERVSE